MKTFAITGIPRSGTTFLAKCISDMDGARCFNEVFYNVADFGEQLEDLSVDLDSFVGSKVLSPYLFNIQYLFAQKLPVMAVLRDPVYTIGSWLSPKCKDMEVSQVGIDNFNMRWAGVPFESSNKIERAAELWEWHANVIFKLRHQIDVFLYELWEKNKIAQEPLKSLMARLPEITIYNDPSRYDNLDEIRVAVEKYCPSRIHWGYE